MREIKVASVALGLIIGVLGAVPANAWEREKNKTELYAFLPQQAEGLAVHPDTGRIYAAASSGALNLFVTPATGCPGCTVETLSIKCPNCNPALTGQLLGVSFTPNGRLLIVDSGGGRVLNLGSGTPTGDASVFMTLPTGDNRSATATLNAMAFDASNIYVSDSGNGMIWIMNRSDATGVATAWIQDDLLSPAMGLLPPFGANGLAFREDGRLLVANTANRNIIQIPVTPPANPGDFPVPGTPSVLATGINGPDGIERQPTTDNLWVAANMSDEIVVIDSISGRAIAKLGDFKGLIAHGGECPPNCRPSGLLFPTNLAFAKNGKHVYIANAAFSIDGSIVQRYANLVTTWTISRMETTIPEFCPGCFP
jgi:DNA-binding beta-propeller fold protein YncE